MGPYSHYLLATMLRPILQPSDARAYAWGAVAPDIRTVAGLPRSQTHLDEVTLRNLSARYPDLSSFVLGYQVHCWLDQIDVVHLLEAAFPFNRMKRLTHKQFSLAQMTMLVELYFLRTAPAPDGFAGAHNALLADLGITPDQSQAFAQAMQTYIGAHSVEAAVSAYQKMGILENTRLKKYQKMAQSMNKRKWLLALLMGGVKNAGVEQHAIRHVCARQNAVA